MELGRGQGTCCPLGSPLLLCKYLFTSLNSAVSVATFPTSVSFAIASEAAPVRLDTDVQVWSKVKRHQVRAGIGACLCHGHSLSPTSQLGVPCWSPWFTQACPGVFWRRESCPMATGHTLHPAQRGLEPPCHQSSCAVSAGLLLPAELPSVPLLLAYFGRAAPLNPWAESNVSPEPSESFAFSIFLGKLGLCPTPLWGTLCLPLGLQHT